MATLVAGSNLLWPDGEGNPYGDTSFLLSLFGQLMSTYNDELEQALLITFGGDAEKLDSSMMEFLTAFRSGQLMADASSISAFPGSFWILAWWPALLMLLDTGDNPEP